MTDELRAKFEAWWQRLLQTPGSASYNSQMPAEGDYRGVALLAYQAAHASRDAEVEALTMHAERWFQLCLILDDNGLSEGDMSIIRDAMNMGSGALERFLDENAAMAKESGE